MTLLPLPFPNRMRASGDAAARSGASLFPTEPALYFGQTPACPTLHVNAVLVAADDPPSAFAAVPAITMALDNRYGNIAAFLSYCSHGSLLLEAASKMDRNRNGVQIILDRAN